MAQSEHNPGLIAKLAPVPIVPVMVIDGAEDGVALARALIDGGIRALEITLRTSGALDGLRAIAAMAPADVLVGVGTVRAPAQARDAIAAGARFVVSPGMTPRLVQDAETWPVPFLPGAVTASEAMALGDIGYRALKFFPADAAGGVTAVKGLAAPLSDMSFVPTGGVGPSNLKDYLALPNVAAVGGSWVCPAPLMRAGDWAGITQLAREAVELAASASG
jgi:2-dehydro-3-deoxyphosphogluconate aldolase/(4S)-4-hydroxy-2-oxoglutarate aldolase